MPVDPELLQLICCPRCRGPLALSAGEDGLQCAKCRVLYPVIDGIPQLLVDEARPLEG